MEEKGRTGNKASDISYGKDKEEEARAKKHIIYFLAVFLCVIVVFMAIPFRNIPLNPEPRKIPDRSDVISNYSIEYINYPAAIKGGKKNSNNITHSNKSRSYNYYGYYDYSSYINASNPIIKRAANMVASYGCDDSEICYAKAIFYFVRDKVHYISEKDEYIQADVETLITGGGDCEDKAILLSSMLSAIGIPTVLIAIPGHMFVKAYISKAPEKYLTNDRWVILDPSCPSCGFGKIPKYDKEQYLSGNYRAIRTAP